MRVPAVLGHNFSDFPVVGPYLTADAQLTQHWKHRLAQYPARKIGIHWRVGHQQGIGAHRSIPLAEFVKLTILPNVQLISLQKGPAADEATSFPNIINLGPQLDENTGAFIETAAVLKNLDLLITCDTAIGHVAGALGVSVWLALCNPCDWRWHQSGETTQWYSSMRLFRQPTPGNWPGVIEQISCALS
jgi:ADP-heptose:LPS heptosyltransferase